MRSLLKRGGEKCNHLVESVKVRGVEVLVGVRKKLVVHAVSQQHETELMRQLESALDHECEMKLELEQVWENHEREVQQLTCRGE